MVTAIYISDRSVQAAVGKKGKKRVQVGRLFRRELPEGVVVNGVIVQEEALLEVVREALEIKGRRSRRIHLVLSSALVNVKRLKLPAVPEKKLRMLVEHEMEATAEQTLCEYRRLGREKKMLRVVGAAAEEAPIEAYRKLFARLGVRLDKILVSRLCLEKLLGRTRQFDTETGIFELFDGQQMTSMILVEGECRYFSQSYLSGAHGSFQFGLEVARSVSNLQQFFATQDQRKLEKVFLLGISNEDFLICEEAISQMVSEAETVQACSVPELQSLGTSQEQALNCAAVLGALFRDPGEIHFSVQMGWQKKKAKRGEFWNYASVPLLTAFGCAAIFAALRWTNGLREMELAEVNVYLENAYNQSECERSDRLSAENGLRSQMVKAVEYMERALASYPNVNSEVTERIEACAGGTATLRVTSYESESGQLTLEADVAEAEQAHTLIEALEETGLFCTVDYSGYEYVPKTERYEINVTCRFKEQAGKEVQE